MLFLVQIEVFKKGKILKREIFGCLDNLVLLLPHSLNDWEHKTLFREHETFRESFREHETLFPKTEEKPAC